MPRKYIKDKITVEFKQFIQFQSEFIVQIYEKRLKLV